MKIYFAGSISGGRDDQEVYYHIIQLLKKHGQVLTEHVGHMDLTFEESLSSQEIYQRDRTWLEGADVLVAECTKPSLGVGYEIGLAEKMSKRVLALFRPEDGKRLSAMVAGNNYVTVQEYHRVNDLPIIFQKFFGQ